MAKDDDFFDKYVEKPTPKKKGSVKKDLFKEKENKQVVIDEPVTEAKSASKKSSATVDKVVSAKITKSATNEKTHSKVNSK